MDNENKGKKKFSLSTQIMIGMGLGFGAGIFFGEYCAFLQIIGNAFIKLLQITILPYIIVSMILGIGGLTADQAKLMVKKAGILMLLFILFAAWFSGSTFSLMQYPTFVFAGLLSFFGGVDVAMPFMLDLMRIPADLYQLYVVTGIINGRFATLLAAMNLVIFTLLATASLTGVMTINKKKVTNYVVITLLLTVGVIGATRVYFSIAVKNFYTKDQVIANMQSHVFPVPRKVHKTTKEALNPVDLNKPTLQGIRESGVLRVGYHPDNLPFSYFSKTGELIGFDIDMAQLLAREMNVKLEFFRLNLIRWLPNLKPDSLI